MTLLEDVEIMLAKTFPHEGASYPHEDPPARPEDGLPAGTWINCRGVRRFVPLNPTWKPADGVRHEEESVFMRLMQEPPTVDVPPFRAHRHICGCGCLLFGIENCPNCEWLQRAQERTA